jgi:simple sugar transport system ATP-binding protein
VVSALDDVSLEVEKGTIHAVVGENGAGKTTLMRILYGALQPDQGQLTLAGEPTNFHSSADAIAAGVGMVSQHYAIIPELTVLQNLILGAEGSALPNSNDLLVRADALATSMGFDFEWNRPAADMSPARAQKLEILKLLWRNSEVMILDEPTAMLSPSDSEGLFASLHHLAAAGKTILLVTHRLPEVMEHSKRVTVLRGGKLIWQGLVAETDTSRLAQQIVGRALPDARAWPQPTLGAPVLSLKDVAAAPLEDLSMTIRAGELVGIAGVDGSGQRELFQIIAGLLPARGTVNFAGEQNASVEQRLRKGLRIIPEDRHAEGLVGSSSLESNSILGLQRQPTLRRGLAIDVEERNRWARWVVEKFGTKHTSLSQSIDSLSGGNQQRFVAARALGFDPKLILAFQPARGLDLGATVDVYRSLRESCMAGAAAIVVSFELDELLQYCDRILVMYRGRMREAPKDREAIGRLMVGA